jgi:hypothetical protein
MTTTLVVALFVEGRTDERFLPVLIQREIEAILLLNGLKTTDVLEPILVEPSNAERIPNTERILRLAQDTAGYHMLIVHADADYPSAERALAERFEPGLKLVQEFKLAGGSVCEHVIPVIPIQMIEAWMMADVPTLREIIGTRVDTRELGLPLHPHQVESVPEPKRLLLQAVAQALSDRPRRRRNPQRELAILQEPLARQVRLEELRRVPAFQEFEIAVHNALRAMQLAS